MRHAPRKSLRKYENPNNTYTLVRCRLCKSLLSYHRKMLGSYYNRHQPKRSKKHKEYLKSTSYLCNYHEPTGISYKTLKTIVGDNYKKALCERLFGRIKYRTSNYAPL